MYLKEKVIVGLALILSIATSPLWAEEKIEEHLNSGNNYFNQGRYGQAIEEYKKILRKYPTTRPARWARWRQ